jgi:RNA polymerase sigma-70 factor (ECF subfamily)
MNINSTKDICKTSVFDLVFKTYAKDLKRHLYFKYRDMASAEDVLQETFIKLWNNCSKVSYEKVKSYLYTVANNAFLDIKKHDKVVLNHQKGFVNYNKSESPEFLMIESEYLIQVENTIASLPKKQREVFLLSRMEKKKYREIAEMLDVSVKTVEKRMHDALITIREKLGRKI